MHFAFSEEQEELRRTVRTLVDRHGGPAIRQPEQAPAGFDSGLWQQLAGQIGAHALAIPEQHDGAGFSLVETNIVVEELGRRLVEVPFVGSAVISAEALLATGDNDACARLLPGIAAGDSVATLAWADPGHGWSTTEIDTVAFSDGQRWLLDGSKRFVLDGDDADVVLVTARTDLGICLFELAPESKQACLVQSVSMDPTRRLTELRLDSAPAYLIGAEGAAKPVLRRCLDVAAAALAAEQVGAMQRWLHEIVEYTKVRTQFGRPIGSFQAIKHRLADLFVDVESARSMSYAASWAVATHADQAAEWAAMAKSFCSQTYANVASEGIQLHGGIGITWEHEAQLHLKHAHSSEHLFGTSRQHRQRLESLLALA